MKTFVDVKDLKQRVEQVIGLAKAKGAETADCELIQKRDFTVEVRNQNIENLSEAESSQIYLTVSVDHRRAAVSSSDLTPESLEALVAQAVALCRYTDEDPFYSLPEVELLQRPSEPLELYDPQLLEMTTEEKIDRVRDLETGILSRDARLRSDTCSLSTVVAGSAIGNSLGFCKGEVSGMIAVSAAVFAEDQVAEDDLNTGRKQTGYSSARARHVADLKSNHFLAEDAARRVLRKLGARKPKTGRFPVYFEPRMARTLWNYLPKAISGGKIFRKESYLLDRLGSVITSPNITIVDDPTLPRGLRSRSFDDEAVAGRPLTLVKDGELQTYIMGTYSANKLGLRSTGHAGGTSNLLISPGDLSEEEMIRRMERGIWVTSMIGHGVNLATGDFSRGAQGLWVEGGEVRYPIAEFTLNSNLDQMYQDIVMLGSEIDTNHGIQSPGLVVGEMTVSGA